MGWRNAEPGWSDDQPVVAAACPNDPDDADRAARGGRNRRVATGIAALLTVLLVVPLLHGRTVVGSAIPAAAERAADPDPIRTPEGVTAAGAEAQAILDAVVPAGGPGCSAAFAERGVAAWVGVRGLADVATGAALTSDSRFDLGSLGEEFTGTLVLLLAQDGRLALDDVVSEHLDDFPAWADRLTVRELLHHRSGLPADIAPAVGSTTPPGDLATQQQVVDRLRHVAALAFPPGTRFEYAHADYVLLAAIAEAATGQYLPNMLHDRIAGPLRLDLTTDATADLPDLVTGYRSGSGGPTPVTAQWALFGAGGIQATPTDLVRWADNTRTGTIGGDRLVDAQLNDTVPTGVGDSRYGNGVMVGADGSVEHRGTWPGFSVALAVRPGHDRAIALACNDDRLPSATIMQALRRIWFAGP